MNKRLKISLTMVLFFVAICLCNSCYGKSYSIDNIDMQAMILENGSVNIKQKMTYSFKGDFNGIYVTIPYKMNDAEYDSFREQSTLKDSLYNHSGVTINSISLDDEPFMKNASASNGDSYVYTTDIIGEMMQVKMFSPSRDETKTFELNYTLKNVCIKHNDVGELYYNLIGGKWDKTIKNLNIDIYLNQANTNLKIWGHGNYNGVSEIVSNNHAKFKTSDVRPGEYVAVRMLFDLECIPNATKTSNITATDLVLQDENVIGQNLTSKRNHNKKTAAFCFLLLLYWIILLCIYEADKKFQIANIEEEELFQKYNPLIAGCIQGSRDILSRDMIAVILNLINKKNIQLELIPSLKNSLRGDQYIYQISKNPEKENEMDKIEKYIYHWIFQKNEKVNLANRLESLAKEPIANEKFKALDILAKNQLNVLGANRAAVPGFVRLINNILLILTFVWAHISIQELVFNVFNSQVLMQFGLKVTAYIIAFFPIVMGLVYIPIYLIVSIRRMVLGGVQKFSGQKVVSTTITILVFASIIMLITGLFTNVRGLVLDELLIAIALIICLTDNVMLKNSVIMIEDFSKLNALRDKIKDYTLSNQRDIEQIFLWNQYLAYAVSFGVADKIMERIDIMTVDDDLIKMAFSNRLNDMIYSDYSYFYREASMETRFLRNYSKNMSAIAKNWSSGSSGSGGGFSGGGGYSGGGGRGRRPEELFKQKHEKFCIAKSLMLFRQYNQQFWQILPKKVSHHVFLNQYLTHSTFLLKILVYLISR